jgi:hypothetical protein
MAAGGGSGRGGCDETSPELRPSAAVTTHAVRFIEEATGADGAGDADDATKEEARALLSGEKLDLMLVVVVALLLVVLVLGVEGSPNNVSMEFR